MSEATKNAPEVKAKPAAAAGRKAGDGDWGELEPREIEELYSILSTAMPGRVKGAKGPKDQPDPFRSCISCMLSAQSRDVNTAAATNALFALANTPEKILALDDETIARAIKPAGLYNNKTKAIRKFCTHLIEERGGVVPSDREGLMSLPGIGRKCADIVQQFAFGIDTIAVDTHVNRVANRTGLARGKTDAATAVELEKRSPDWVLHEAHFWLIQFGKAVCTSRAPKCAECPVNHLCRAYRSGAMG